MLVSFIDNPELRDRERLCCKWRDVCGNGHCRRHFAALKQLTIVCVSKRGYRRGGRKMRLNYRLAYLR